MTDQVRIGDDGQLEIERTWDGEPLWSVETQQDELFAGDAFKQMPGQLPIEEMPDYQTLYRQEPSVASPRWTLGVERHCGIRGAWHDPGNSWCSEQQR